MRMSAETREAGRRPYFRRIQRRQAHPDIGDVDDIAAVGNPQEKHHGVRHQGKPEGDEGPFMPEWVAMHKPAQAHHLHDEGDQIEFVGQHAAERRRHFAFQALQNQLDQTHHQAAGKPLHSGYPAVVPGQQADAHRIHGDRDDVREEERSVVHGPTAVPSEQRKPVTPHLS